MPFWSFSEKVRSCASFSISISSGRDSIDPEYAEWQLLCRDGEWNVLSLSVECAAFPRLRFSGSRGCASGKGNSLGIFYFIVQYKFHAQKYGIEYDNYVSKQNHLDCVPSQIFQSAFIKGLPRHSLTTK